MCMSTPSVPKPIPAQEIKMPAADALRKRKVAGPTGGASGGLGSGSLLAGTSSSLAGGAQTAGTSMLGG